MTASHGPIGVANAPCSWGALEFELEGGAPGYRQVLAEMAAADYRGTELGDWGFMPTEPEPLVRALAEHRLVLLGGFVPVPLADPTTHDAGLAAALRTARLLAAVNPSALIVLADDNGKVPERVQFAGRIGPQHEMADGQWRSFTRGAERVARMVRDETGLRTVFHHHCAGYLETPDELERLLESTEADLLGLCLDTGHYQFGGGDAAAAVRRYGDRVWHVHFKDCEPRVASQARDQGWDYFRSVREGVFCELGRGEVDFSAVLAALRARDYRGWVVVEQDVLPGMGTPRQSARRNRAHLATLGL
jgi:inosose dehydratase